MISLPDYINQEDWDGYVEMRKEKKRPLTPGARKRALGTLERLYQAGEDVGMVLNQSEDSGWTGLFKVSDSYKEQMGIEKQEAVVLRMVNRDWAD